VPERKRKVRKGRSGKKKEVPLEGEKASCDAPKGRPRPLPCLKKSAGSVMAEEKKKFEPRRGGEVDQEH